MKNLICKASASLCLAFAAVVPLAANAAWSVSPFNTPGASFTQLWGINDLGQIAGGNSFGGFIYSNGVYTYLTAPEGVTAVATGISNNGLVVGSFWANDANNTQTGFILDGSTYTPFTIAGATDTFIRDVSSDGRYLTGTFSSEAVSLGGFVFDRTTSALVQFSDPTRLTLIEGVNTSGIVTGSRAGSSAFGGGGLLYNINTGTTTIYPTASGNPNPRFRGINDAGVIVGFSSDGAGTSIAIVGSPTTGFESFSIPGANFTGAYGISNQNVLVGQYSNEDGSIIGGFIATPVPEPASALLWIAGLGLVAAARRRVAAALPPR